MGSKKKPKKERPSIRKIGDREYEVDFTPKERHDPRNPEHQAMFLAMFGEELRKNGKRVKPNFQVWDSAFNQALQNTKEMVGIVLARSVYPPPSKIPPGSPVGMKIEEIEEGMREFLVEIRCREKMTDGYVRLVDLALRQMVADDLVIVTVVGNRVCYRAKDLGRNIYRGSDNYYFQGQTLGFTPAERELLDALEGRPLEMSALLERLDVSRTTFDKRKESAWARIDKRFGDGAGKKLLIVGASTVRFMTDVTKAGVL